VFRACILCRAVKAVNVLYETHEDGLDGRAYSVPKSITAGRFLSFKISDVTASF